MYNILILGSGGREHALAWKIKQSSKCKTLFVAPGNAGTASLAENVALDILDFNMIESYVDEHNIDYIIVGPEAPLVEGIYDHFRGHDVHVIGPSAAASKLEGSKAFANAFMDEFKIPTAGYVKITKDNLEEGYSFIDAQDSMIVLKADGLAAGKGVLILDNKEQAKAELQAMIEGKFGQASETVVIEEFLDGIEFSVFVYTDGMHYHILPVAKDYKRIGEGDTGLNTGGMGAVSPVPFVDVSIMDKVVDRIVIPTLRGLQSRQLEYTGFIFLGLIKVNDDPYVIEYNCRMGDPETEVVIPRIESDIVDLFEASVNGNLSDIDISVSEKAAATTMLVSGGYPEAYEKGKVISLGDAVENTVVFHAGTTYDQDGQLITNGGRVIAVTAFGDTHSDAVRNSQEHAKDIHFEKVYYRKDIGFDL